MNSTKWEELRQAFYSLGEHHPRWRTKDLNGHISEWDGDWYYHFKDGGYESIDWLEIRIDSATQDDLVIDILCKVHVPGHRIEGGFRVYGYQPDGVALRYFGSRGVAPG